MDTKDLVQIKKERLREELEKLVPPGFFLQPPPKNRGEIYDDLDKFLGIDQDLSMRVGYLVASNKGYDTAISHLRFFGLKIHEAGEVKNTGPFFNNPQLNKDLEEAADYIIRFYELAKINVKRIDEEVDAQLKVIQNQRDKQKAEQQKQKATKFVSGATGFRTGNKINVRVSRGPGIIPKRTAPQQVLETISRTTTDASESDEKIGGSRKLVTDLGRVTLQIEQTNNNLNRVIEIIAEDIKNTKENNRKEVDEYRRRVANRGRTLGRRELGSSKVDVTGVVKKYVGSFFSGTGGSIRALASFNLLQKLLEGDFAGAIGPLFGIGLTYLPQIGAFVAGLIGKKLVKGIFSGGGRAASPSRARITGDVPKVPKLGRLGKIGLGLSALSLGGALLGRDGSEDETETQKRLDELTQQQKQSADSGRVSSIPQSELQKFESLNKKFESILDFLLKKQKETETQQRRGSGGPGGAPTGELPPSTGELTGTQREIENKMFDYLKQNYGENVAYAMLSNAMRESGYRTNAPESGFQGMFQWDANRWSNLENWARSKNLDPMDRGTQLRFAIMESEQSGTLGRMKSAKSKEEASSIFYNEFERGAYSRPIKGNQYTPDNPHERSNLQFLEDIKKRQEKRIPTPIPLPQAPKPQEKQLKPDDKGDKVSFLPLGTSSATPSVPSSSSVATNPTTSVSTGGGVTELLAMNCRLSSGCIG